ncbi:hypothetical protein GCM10023149_44260 [Mucilaginibacter gynuensis]|uniref:Immunity protein 27 of polymorphic toxin system n=1 Tax=Mucilaginibacter gynuensis TaxID=1302236 RepID=A0ABP8H8Q9_9SPHI
MKIKKEETKIVCEWIFDGKKMHKTSECDRIEWLVNNYLIMVANKDGWEKLYQDPSDQRYWEYTYPDSEMQGGGPQLLTVLSNREAKIKYNL